jgi:hypothetical protein
MQQIPSAYGDLAFVLCNDCSKTRDVHVSAADITHVQSLSKICMLQLLQICLFLQVACKLVYVYCIVFLIVQISYI